ncbi:MAG: Fic family protein [Candidatus Roizmanbacteria bacterium]|nr:Fic family protein [Candidatus Roizmanbacteria bacterium]MCR4313468.1 Fic family protein [Candidatus Roizmanbacteria bacterium]
MFNPKYTITNKLLKNIKHITTLTHTMSQWRFPEVVLVELQKNAEAVSAFASTSIEGNPLPLTDVKRILKTRPAQIRESEQEVLNYNQALQDVNAKLNKQKTSFNLSFIISLQKKITDKLLPVHQSGRVRTQPVFVNNPHLGKTVYWPPDAQDVLPLVEELMEFIKTSKQTVDPLIVAGIFHKQMVIIHPFMDGNGRTTRLATKILLAQMGLDTFYLFSFENYYNNNVSRYFEIVGVKGNYYDLVSLIDFTEWLEYFTDGIIDELLRVEKTVSQLFINPHNNLKPHHQIILQTIQQNGFINDSEYAKLTTRARATRYLDFQKLINVGLIKPKGKGKSTYYILKELKI